MTHSTSFSKGEGNQSPEVQTPPASVLSEGESRVGTFGGLTRTMGFKVKEEDPLVNGQGDTGLQFELIYGLPLASFPGIRVS